jgi:hypothetical protein
MKRLIIFGLATASVVGFVLAQGSITSGGVRWTKFQTYDARTPPPLSLSEAYTLALAHIDPASNIFYCVSASCLEKTNNGWTGWRFLFSNTNGQKGRVVVYFDREIGPWVPGRMSIEK